MSAWRRPFESQRPFETRACAAAAITLSLWLAGGCSPAAPPSNTTETSLAFNNTTDPTNNNASYIGSAACGACHPDVLSTVRIHGHAQALKAVEAASPTYPAQGTRAGVPNPPAGLAWSNVSFVIGGYTQGAFFVDSNGFILTDGTAGVNTQWYLTLPANGTVASFAPYLPNQTTPLPYTFDCFRCHTTGPLAQDPNDPRAQEGRPGIQGTWAENAVLCEACHGPGSTHAPDPHARALFVDPTPQTCGRCHAANNDPNEIPVVDGYFNSNAQYAELRASGGHSAFACTVCHDPHASTVYQRGVGLRNQCITCHATQNMAFHDGKVFERGDYVEALACESCHMPYTGRSNSVATAASVGSTGGRMGDVRGHIFRIDTQNSVYTETLSADGTSVLKDAQGRAAVTPDFVCLRCHNGVGNVFELTPTGATQIIQGMHRHAQTAN